MVCPSVMGVYVHLPAGLAVYSVYSVAYCVSLRAWMARQVNNPAHYLQGAKSSHCLHVAHADYSPQAPTLLQSTAACMEHTALVAPDTAGLLPGHVGWAMTQSSSPAVPLGLPGHQEMPVALTPDCCQALPLRMMLVHRGAECCGGIIMLHSVGYRAAAGDCVCSCIFGQAGQNQAMTNGWWGGDLMIASDLRYE